MGFPGSAAAASAKSLQSCPTLCDPIDGSPPGSPVPGILQARALEWVGISSPTHESEKWKWSRSVMPDSLRPHGLQPTRLLCPWDFPGKSTGMGCHRLLQVALVVNNPSANAGDVRWGFNPWVGKISWRRKWQPNPVLLPGEFHGQSSLMGYSP